MWWRVSGRFTCVRAWVCMCLNIPLCGAEEAVRVNDVCINNPLAKTIFWKYFVSSSFTSSLDVVDIASRMTLSSSSPPPYPFPSADFCVCRRCRCLQCCCCCCRYTTNANSFSIFCVCLYFFRFFYLCLPLQSLYKFFRRDDMLEMSIWATHCSISSNFVQ